MALFFSTSQSFRNYFCLYISMLQRRTTPEKKAAFAPELSLFSACIFFELRLALGTSAQIGLRELELCFEAKTSSAARAFSLISGFVAGAA